MARVLRLRTADRDEYGASPWDDTVPHGSCDSQEGRVCGAHLATEVAGPLWDPFVRQFVRRLLIVSQLN